MITSNATRNCLYSKNMVVQERFNTNCKKKYTIGEQYGKHFLSKYTNIIDTDMNIYKIGHTIPNT